MADVSSYYQDTEGWERPASTALFFMPHWETGAYESGPIDINNLVISFVRELLPVFEPELEGYDNMDPWDVVNRLLPHGFVAWIGEDTKLNAYLSASRHPKLNQDQYEQIDEFFDSTEDNLSWFRTKPGRATMVPASTVLPPRLHKRLAHDALQRRSRRL